MASRDPARVVIADRVDRLYKSLIVNGCFWVNCGFLRLAVFALNRLLSRRLSAAPTAVHSPESTVHRLRIVAESGIGRGQAAVNQIE